MEKLSHRHETHQAIDTIGRRLHLHLIKEQDWAIEAADPSRLSEFCEVYRSAPLSSHEKFVLMQIIVASLDDYLNITLPAECDTSLGSMVENLLKQDFALHRPTILMWCHFDPVSSEAPEPQTQPWNDEEWGDDEEWGKTEDTWEFHVAPLMRRIWDEFTPSVTRPALS